jgi:hypothetical protein
VTSTRHDGPARPLAFGYLSLPAHTGPAGHEETVTAATRDLAAYAAREGYALAGIFTDVRGCSEAGLYGLLDAVRRGEAVAVVVPGLDHLRHVGCLAGADLRTTARYLRARLLTLTPEPGTSTSVANRAGPDAHPREHRRELDRWAVSAAAVAGARR